MTTYIKINNMSANERAWLKEEFAKHGYEVKELITFFEVNDVGITPYLEDFYHSKFKHNFDNVCRLEDSIIFIEYYGKGHYASYAIDKDGNENPLEGTATSDYIEEIEHEKCKTEECEKFRAQLDQALVI